MRPLPVVLRLIAFTDQLSAISKETQRVNYLLYIFLFPVAALTFSDFSCWVTARAASAFLDVEGSAIASSAQGMCLGVALTYK